MILPIDRKFSQLENQRKQLLADIEKLSHEQQNFKVSQDSWSIFQVIAHLITAETNTLKYMKKKILGIDQVPKAGIVASLRAQTLNTFLKLPIKYKAPKAALPEFENVYFFENTKKEWDNLREQFITLLNQFDVKNSNKLIFKHPVAGRLNIHQALNFMEEHIIHHEKQIARIKNHPDFPST